jgi:hypothetical protein
MRRERRGFRFLGFIALADLLFALSAGMLLLNPIQLGDQPTPKPAPEERPAKEPEPEYRPPVRDIVAILQKVEESVKTLESQGAVIARQAAEILKNE